MSVLIESLGIDRLSVEERLILIDQIWDTLPENLNPQEIPAWHFPYLGKRRADADKSPGDGKPWREALSRFENES